MTRSLRPQIERELYKDLLIGKYLKQLISKQEKEELTGLLCMDRSDTNTAIMGALQNNNFILAASILYYSK